MQKYYVYAGFIGFATMIEMGLSIYLKYQVVHAVLQIKILINT